MESDEVSKRWGKLHLEDNVGLLKKIRSMMARSDRRYNKRHICPDAKFQIITSRHPEALLCTCFSGGANE
jgi:hypothetical protein